MSTGPAVAKTVWTEADFDAMDWHDNAVHAVALEPALPDPGRLLLDLDYIVEWVAPRGFTQYLRRAPIHAPGFFLSAAERGGFSFDQHGYTP
jgi:hypothetical protein